MLITIDEDRQEVTPGKQNVMLFAQRTSYNLSFFPECWFTVNIQYNDIVRWLCLITRNRLLSSNSVTTSELQQRVSDE